MEVSRSSPDGDTSPTTCSSVDVAEGSSKSVHGVTLGDVGELALEHTTKGYHVVQSTVTARRQIQEGNSISDSVLAVLDVLVLPDPPDAVNLGVMNWT